MLRLAWVGHGQSGQRVPELHNQTLANVASAAAGRGVIAKDLFG
jgi:hypothetical protein